MKRQQLIVVLIISIFFGCQENNGNPENKEKVQITENENLQNQQIEVEKAEEKEFLVAIVGNLRMREIPDVEGGIVGKMDYGQRAIYLNEESNFKEKIKLRGKMRYDSWKKVKINFENQSNEIIGWVYGGGLINETEIYQEVSNGKFERKVNRANEEEVSDLLDIKIEEDYFYDGVVRYKKDNNGNLIKDGKFKITGNQEVEISNNYEAEINVEITGNYRDGKPDGIFELKFSGYENSNVTTVNYENGNCLWSSCMGSSEGMDYNHREENPKDCSFRYIQKKLNEVNGWN